MSARQRSIKYLVVSIPSNKITLSNSIITSIIINDLNLCSGKTFTHVLGRRYTHPVLKISPMMQRPWSSMMHGSNLGFKCYIHELRRMKPGRKFQEFISAHCFIVCSLSSFFLLDKSSIANDIPENDNDDFACLNLESSV
jgi:hypothetical protein